MHKTAITRVSNLFARRKIEAAALSIVAAISAVGIGRGQGFARGEQAEVPLTNAVHVSAALKSTLGGNATTRPATAGRVLDLPYISHPRVESWIERFTTDQRRSFATYLDRMTRYEPMISGKLAERDMPQGLIYLAMIESGFNPTAKSPVKARGLWQFMAPTAKQYGLRVTGKVDERTNPARSTEAALEYLDDLYKRFGSWYLAAAAYNTGQGRVARILKQQTGKTKGTDADYYRIAHKLPRETREYVPKMIAAATIGANPTQYGFRSD